MSKFQIFFLGVITMATAAWFFISPSYIVLVVTLGWKSFLIFPLFYGLIAWLIIYIYGDVDMSIDVFIKDKIKNPRLKKKLLKIYGKSRFFALCLTAFTLCPLVAPILAKLCIKNKNRALLAGILLNITTTTIWIPIYLFGWKAIKAIMGV
ncbi:MAG: hypothetical protein COU51_00240 [Parcubacteria group bacterium CG10_big_fil_rev_8_21_14_0_10_36_14]|nr:MAG: hypothetical protein COU51_00240 [Parcubacteria group bacterium CG10_big_fil_rev_8_21_14_0_10_36_14]